MGGKNKMRPFAGSRPAGSNTKAPRLPKKRGSGGAGDGSPRKKKERSVWGLVAAVGSFAALFGWTLLSRGKAAKADRRILDSMLAKPLRYTEHASCRMDCRCVWRWRAGLQEPWLRRGQLPLSSRCAPRTNTNTYAHRSALPRGARFIGKAEVVEALRSGAINQRKSAPGLRPCPKYTVDAEVSGKRVQAVFSASPAETSLITVIDRDTDWPCGPC